MTEKRWLLKEPFKSTEVDEFRSTMKVSPIIAELLLQRNIRNYDDAESFFRPSLKDLHDPFIMKDMNLAYERVCTAIADKESVLLYGDYDVDGTTAVSLLYSFLKNRVTNLDYYIPDRYTEGYGVSEKGIAYAKDNGVDLLITLDCGVKANSRIDQANNFGIDVIICDHHTPGSELPNCIVLNPKRSDCEYPFKELSGCGVGFKLLQALARDSQDEMDELYSLLDFVAISIGADIVDVTGENRILASHGMRILNADPRTAFEKLIELANKTFPLSLTDVIFSIAPRINAAGRLRSGKFAVELMITDDYDLIEEIAVEIDNDNTERKELDQSITQDALEMLETDSTSKDLVTTVLYSDSWHKGVVGIVASRIIESYYRPTIILTESNGLVTGSARSIKGFDIHWAIDQCSDLLEQFGGHKFAAGLTLLPENLEKFKEKFENVVSKKIEKSLLIEEQIVDIELSFDQIFNKEENRMKIPRLKRIISQFEPHGPGNMKPVFISKNVFTTDIRLLKEKHLKLSMTQPEHDVVIDGIGFNLGEKMDLVAAGLPFDVVYTLEVNRWKNRETLQLNIKDIRSTI